MLTTVFMGTAPFAVPCLQAVASRHQVLTVVSQPDRPHGRGMRLQPTPVKAAAQELGLEVLQPERASQPDFVEVLRRLAPQVLVVVAYGQILRPTVLEVPPLGSINVHGSLLPLLRGAAPIQRAILDGHTRTGVTTMFMDAGMDTGDMILRAETPIDPMETAGELAIRLAPLGAELLLETLAQLEAGTAPRIPQDSSQATYAAMLRREDGALQWNVPPDEFCRRVHGCNPAPGAFAHREGRLIKVWRAGPTAADASRPPGTVLQTSPHLVLATRGGAVSLMEVQPEARARLTGAELARGYRVMVGEQWQPGILQAG